MIFTCFKDDIQKNIFDNLCDSLKKSFQLERIDINSEEISIYSKDGVDVNNYISRIKSILSSFQSIKNIDLQINITLNNI